jgi:hypothetical protein
VDPLVRPSPCWFLSQRQSHADQDTAQACHWRRRGVCSSILLSPKKPYADLNFLNKQAC